MPKVIEFDNADGPSTLVAISLPGDDVQAVSKVTDRAFEAVDKAESSFDRLLGPVVAMGSSLHRALQETPVQEATIELSVQISAKGTVYVVESQAQAAIKVSLSVRS
jgi:hypothetical protein